jgi:heptosyltransferase II
MRTVVRLPNWIGDTILALPALEALAGPPGAEVLLAGRPPALLLTRHLAPGAPRLALGSGGPSLCWLRDAAALRAARAERGVLLTPALSAALWLRAGGVAQRVGWDSQGRGPLLTRRVERAPRGSRHLVDEFVDLARDTGAACEATTPRLSESPAEAARAIEFLDRALGPERGRPLVALCPGAFYGPAKQWPVASYAELARRLAGAGVDGIVIGTEPDRPSAARIVGEAGSARWVDAIGVGSILVAAELMRRAAAVVTNDSGTMHVAGAVGTPVVAFFGPTDPRWTGPRGARDVVLRRPLPCAPCFRRRCPYGAPSPCLAGIAPGEAAERALEAAGARGRRALFLDRDGTLIAPVAYLGDPDGVRLVAGAARAIRAAREAGCRIVIVTNQSGLARGFYREEQMDRVHARIAELLAREGAAIDRVYHCPHHPDLTGPCGCRKPEPGLFLRAAQELGIDLARSAGVGDTIEDLRAASRAGCRPILVRTGYGAVVEATRASEMPRGSWVAEDLAQAVDRWLWSCDSG